MGADATTILGTLPAGDGERDIHVPGNTNLTLSGMTISGGRGGENEAYSTPSAHDAPAPWQARTRRRD